MAATFSTPPRPHQRTITPSAPMGLPPPPSHAPSYCDYSPYPLTCNTVLSRRKKMVFDSVFPPSDAVAAGVSTPMASFAQGAQSRSQSQGTQNQGSSGSSGVNSQGERDWDRMWHVATTVLRFEDRGFEGASAGDETPWVTLKNKYVNQKEVLMSKHPGVESGIRALLTKFAEEEAEQTSCGRSNEARTVSSLVEWYSWEVKRHYLAWIKPKIVDELLSVDEHEGVEAAEWRLRSILEKLRGAWEVYVGVGRRWVFRKVSVGSATPRLGQAGSRVGEALFGSGRKGEASSGSIRVDEEEDTEDDEEFDVRYVDGEEDGDVDEVALGKFVRSLNSILGYSLRDPEWSRLVYEVFIELCGCILNSPPGMAGDEEGDEGREEQRGEEQAGDGDTNALDAPSIVIDDSIIVESEEFTQIDDDMLLNTPTPTAPHSRSRNQSRSPPGDLHPKIATPKKRTKKQIAAQAFLLTTWSHLQTLNLGGSGRRGERVFAEVISVLVTKYIEGMYASHWANEDEEGYAKDVTVEIGEWIEQEVGGLVRLVLVGDGKGKGKREGGGAGGRRKGGVHREARDRVLSPRASFRASELGIGGGSVRRRGASRLSIDGVMLGATPTGSTRRGGGLAALAAFAGVNVGRLLNRGLMKGDAVGEAEEDVSDVILRKEDIEGWKKMALGRLGRLRVRELFEIVVDWPDSLGGVMDLRAYITTPQTRMHLTTTFTTAINNRILHPAASTTDILRVYISIIRAFSVLDPRGVLLDRVTRSIRRYLREREDTVRVIVKGLMGGDSSVVKREDDDHSSGNNTRGLEEDDLSDLAEDLLRGSTTAASQAATAGDELDFDDMTWTPDPIDAGPEYRHIKGTDVVGSLISLYESKEVFVKEFQAVLADRLLECRDYEGVSEEVKSYEPEIQTLELLRGRFGEGSVQGCDVMLRDVQVGARTDMNVRNEEQLPSAKDGGVEFHAKILSHLFWPTEVKDEVAVSGAIGGAGGWSCMGGAWGAVAGEKKKLYKLPKEIAELQKRYERGFEKLNRKRKLEWRDALGYVRVELELEDRIVEVRDAKPWCVAVINAFGDNESGGGSGGEGGEGGEGERWKRVRKTVKELRKELEMSEGLVRRGLQYWVAKGVLGEVKPSPSSSAVPGNETYIVVERMDDTSNDSPSIPTGESTNATGQEEVEEAEVAMDTTPDAGDGYAEQPLSAEKQVYTQFIVGMLTNAAGPMGLDKIMMMLGMLVPGGVRCGRKEMGELVERLVREGRVEGGEGVGGWRAKK